MSFHSARSKNNLVEPAFEILDIEASSRTYDLTYRQRVQTPTTEIAVGIGAGSRETDTSLLGVDFPLSPGVEARDQLLYLRLWVPEGLVVVLPDVQLAMAELLSIKQFGLGGSQTVRGYRQNSLVAEAQLRYPIWYTRDKKGVLQVTPFVDFGNVWNNDSTVALQPNSLLSEGLGRR